MEGSYIVSIRDIVSKGEGLFIKKSIKYEKGLKEDIVLLRSIILCIFILNLVHFVKIDQFVNSSILFYI